MNGHSVNSSRLSVKRHAEQVSKKRSTLALANRLSVILATASVAAVVGVGIGAPAGGLSLTKSANTAATTTASTTGNLR